jgi:uncharacterized protein (TIGR02588 family)
MSNTSNRAENERGKRTPAEWTTFLVASTILLAVVGLVLYDWLGSPDTPPQFNVTQGNIRATNEQFYVPFTVENTGGDTAQNVQIVAELMINGEVVEDGEQQIEFLSGGETEEGEFVFREDPVSGELTLRVASYTEP